MTNISKNQKKINILWLHHCKKSL